MVKHDKCLFCLRFLLHKHVYFIYAIFSHTSISDIRLDVPELSDDNYKVWKERILLHLGCMDIYYAIRKDKPIVTDISTPTERLLHDHWERSNRLSVMYIKSKISASICGFVDQYNDVRALLKSIDKLFETSDKALASTLIMKFSLLRFTNVRGVREHIMKMRNIAVQLKNLEIEIFESFLVHYILNTFSKQYESFKISYNTHKDKWSINELMTMCVQEEGRLIIKLGNSALGNPISCVMNLIWLKLVITHGGLILVLQSTFQIPCKVCKP